MAKTNSTYARLVNFFKSKVARNVTIILLFTFSILGMFLLDKDNLIRDKYLAFLNSNFIADLMVLLNIGRYNITIGAWLIFLCIMLVVIILVFGNIFAEKAISSKVEKEQKKFNSYASCWRLYSFLYHLGLLLIAGAIIFIFYMLGAFDKFNTNSANVFLSLLYTVLICLIFVLIIPTAITIIYLLYKFAVLVAAFIVSSITMAARDIAASSALQRKLDEEFLEKARNQGSEEETQVAPKVRKDAFGPLTKIDEMEREEEVADTDVSLNEIALRFQSFAINNHKIYYELPVIRSYIAGLSASRLVILEGLSGTGKSTLPRMFAEFTSSVASFTPVQATWRDKTDLLGYYSEFSKTFKTTDFLKALYSASYTGKISQLVLDEINISRVEYYFADFLSILEYPESDWKIKVFDAQPNQELPAKLTEGYVTIPNNSWFVGTANTDDSTFTITDKVYDRAIVIDFEEKFDPITSTYNSDPISLSAKGLTTMFEEAKNNEAYKLTSKDLNKFSTICNFVKDAFDIKFGNRILVQIENFVPVYVALGGTKEEALDFMFSRKILRKLQGAYQDYIKEELAKLKKLIEDSYGKGVFKETESLMAKINKRLV